MISLKSACHHKDSHSKPECFHSPCTIVRQFTNGRLLIENNRGKVRAVDMGEITEREEGG